MAIENISCRNVPQVKSYERRLDPHKITATHTDKWEQRNMILLQPTALILHTVTYQHLPHGSLSSWMSGWVFDITIVRSGDYIM